MERLLTPEKLVEITGLSRQTIYNRLSTGGDLPPVVRLGRALRWRASDVAAWIAAKISTPAFSMPLPVAPPLVTSRRRGRPTKAEQIAYRSAACAGGCSDE